MRKTKMLVGLFSLMLSACGLMGEGAPFQALNGDSEPLKTRFNEDAGHVRIVMLASPT